MINFAKTLQDDMKTTFTRMSRIYKEAEDLVNLYEKGSVQTDIAALDDTDPATEATRLTKLQVTKIYDLAFNMERFFDAQNSITTDYLATIQEVLYGEAVATKISEKTEAFGNKGVAFCRDVLRTYDRARDHQELYVASELSLTTTVVSDDTIIYGSNMTKKLLVDGQEVMEQYERLLTDRNAPGSDRLLVIAAWSGL